MQKTINLKKAVEFHGHLGPYLVLGLLAGELALKEIGAHKYFNLKVLVYGANIRPKSCLIDGLQLSTGATYGKGNIQKYRAKTIKILVSNKNNGKRITLMINKQLINRLNELKGHAESELLAKQLLKMSRDRIFTLS